MFSQQKIRIRIIFIYMLNACMGPSVPLKWMSSVVHYIDTGNTRPIKIAPRRITLGRHKIVEEEIAKM